MANRKNTPLKGGICGRWDCKDGWDIFSQHASNGVSSTTNTDYLQFLDELLQVALGGLLSHNIKHLSANSAHLARLGVAGGLGLLVTLLLGETNAEHAENIAISGAHINKGLDKSLPLSDEGAQLVASDVHAVEVGQHVIAVHILTHELDLAVSLALVTSIKVSKRHFKHTTLKTLRSDF